MKNAFIAVTISMLIVMLGGCSSERVRSGVQVQSISIEQSFPVSQRALFQAARDALRDYAAELEGDGDKELTISTRDSGDPGRIVAHLQTSKKLLKRRRITFELTMVDMADLGSAMSIQAYPEVYEITPLSPSDWTLSSQSITADPVEDLLRRIETRVAAGQ